MIKSRNLTSHTYNEETTQTIITAIVDEYYCTFCQLNKKLNELADKEQR
ncbi:MAG: nucleotidyltransferase substrate binding protein [Gammaproteobacteria bacterium]|nr:nucleotidyltransferase substrate binding protein [Gammaproteobacteria bacterium]